MRKHPTLSGYWYDYEPQCLLWKNNTPVPQNVPPYKKWVGSGLTCDEYPFNSVAQGGFNNYNKNTVSIRPVPSSEQGFGLKRQGGQLGAFYKKSGVVRNDFILGWFLVVPTLFEKSSYIKRATNNSPAMRVYFNA